MSTNSPVQRSPGLRRKNQKRGLNFTLMVAGSSGSGKTTFLNTLCDSDSIPKRREISALEAANDKTVVISSTTLDMDENGTKLTLSVIDTPGFGDNINNENSCQEIIKYIEMQYDEILAEESKIKRNAKFQGHSLGEMDVEFMKRLSPRVNVIPVIAKADSMTKKELSDFKQRIMADIAHFEIPIYDFPVDPEHDDKETVDENSTLRALMPFSIIGSEGEVKVGKNMVRGRSYPWGVVEVDNDLHCDFSQLRNVLLNSHLQDLKEITHDILYEQFRTERLEQSRTVGESTESALAATD